MRKAKRLLCVNSVACVCNVAATRSKIFSSIIPWLLTTLITLSLVTLPGFAIADSDVIAGADANVNAGFPKPNKDFKTHIEQVKQYLLHNQMAQRQASDVEYNLPFEKSANPSVAYRGRFLLIHGLNDSPYSFTDIAQTLTQKGFDVRAILLPGHGSTPKAQLDMSYKRWLKSAREQLRLWKEDSDAPMYLGGFSMGAVMATLLALENKDIKGLMLFSPAFQSTKKHLLRWAGIYSVFKPWVFGGMIIEDNPTKYNSIPINGVSQYYKLTQRLKRKWIGRRLKIPVLAVATINDSIIDIPYLIDLFEHRFTSKDKHLIIYSNEALELNEEHTSVIASEFPEQRILNQSHQGVIMSASNPLFGESGSVLVCNGNDWPTFSGCLYSRQQHWYGAQHTPSPDGVPVARTTYNPDYKGMFERFDSVFGNDIN